MSKIEDDEWIRDIDELQYKINELLRKFNSEIFYDPVLQEIILKDRDTDDIEFIR